MAGLYSEKVMEHFRSPRNYGKIKDADGVGKIGNLKCGDVMWIYIKVKDGRIADIKFETLGCAAAIASSSMLTEMAKGKALEEALKITSRELAGELGDLPVEKLHCSVLAADGLAEAIYDYYRKKGMKVSGELEERHRALAKRSEHR